MMSNDETLTDFASVQDAAAVELAFARQVLLKISLCPPQDIPNVADCVAQHLRQAEQILLSGTTV